MKTLAAILVETDHPLELVELALPALQPGQVLVDVTWSGVCHTQLHEVRGRRGPDPFLPHCLGHEGSGVVREITSGVTRVKPGDAVVLSWLKGPGCNVPGTKYGWGDRAVNAGGVTTFQRAAVVSENRLTPLPEGVDARQAAMLGCAVPTGLGAVFNTASPTPGESLAVFGCGGVGLCAVAAARIAGCEPIVAIDRLDSKLKLARQMGATHTFNADTVDVLDAVRSLKLPLDIAIEATGVPAVMERALQAVRAQGGRAVIIGNAAHGQRWAVDPQQLNQGKRILGTWGGDCEPARDLPRYARLIAAGRLDLEPLMDRSYSLNRINEALADLEAGRATRPMIDCCVPL